MFISHVQQQRKPINWSFIFDEHRNGDTYIDPFIFLFPQDVAQRQAWCPNSYSRLESNCYKVPDGKLAWQDAKTFCEIEMSHLITINNKKEDVLLRSILRSSHIREVWIGLNDLAYEDFFQWSDGSQVRKST